MSLHDDVSQRLRQELDGCGPVDISPTTLALRVSAAFGADIAEVHVRYGCVEHFKQMARRLLANKFEAEGQENDSHQGDMFSGHLQERYPVPHAPDAEPLYRPREMLSQNELDWNIAQLEKSANARLRHADALRAYRDSRCQTAAA